MTTSISPLMKEVLVLQPVNVTTEDNSKPNWEEQVPPTTPSGCLNTQRGTIHEPRVTASDVTTDHCPDDTSILGTASPDK